MKAKIYILLIFTLSIIQNYAYPQKLKPAYIVKNKVDTIYGSGNVNRDQEFCFFERSGSKEKLKFYPQEIDAFRIIDGKYYVPRQIPDKKGELKWYFLEFLVDGEIDLFAISHYRRFFIKKDNEPFLELDDNDENIERIDGQEYMVKDKTYIGYIRVYMSETPELYPKIDRMDNLNQRDLVKISTDYHHAVCDDYDCINYSKKLIKITYQLELYSGAEYHNSYYTPMAGALLHISKPMKNSRFGIKVGLLYADHWAVDKSEYYPEERDYRIKIPLSVQFAFGKRKFKPAISVGFITGTWLLDTFQAGFIYSFSDKFGICLNGSIDGVIPLLLGNHNDMYNNPFGHSLSFGLVYTIK